MRVPSFHSAGSAVPFVACLVLGLAGCRTTEVKVWNLEQLHAGDSRHRYQAALQGDTGWFWRRQILGIFQGAGAQYASAVDLEEVDNPAAECLENLIALQERARVDGPPDPRHVEWFARLAVEDSSKLSRERAVLGLAGLGARLPIGLPSRLGADQTPAGPDVLAPVLEELVRAVRGLVEGKPNAESEVVRSAAAVRALDLDLAAGRRALRASAELSAVVDRGDQESTDLAQLVQHLESLCVRRALAAALEDKDELVRAAAVRGVAATGGARGFDAVLYDRMRTETAAMPLRALLEVLAEHGLPQAPAGGPPLAHTSEDWLKFIQVLAVQHPEGELRVRAMQTLQVVAAPEVQSLREEDWYRWWLARKEAGNSTATNGAALNVSGAKP